MKIRTDKQDPTLVLDLEGELDAEGSAALEERCLYEQQEGVVHFVISLGSVERVTGPGLRVLLGLARSLPRSGGSLVLCKLEPKVLQALRVSGLDDAFEIAPDLASALGRSKQLLETGSRSQPVTGAEAQEKIDYAIALLGSKDPKR
jgi:anti-sigma B factor antagonist